MLLQSTWLLVLTSIATLALVSLMRTIWRQHTGRRALQQVRERGVDTPVSVHPHIDYSTCLGCASCIDVCPEQGVFAIVDGQAHLVGPEHCVGHGVCKSACPMGAIELVIGSPSRPVQVPLVNPGLQSSVPGLFVAGELNGQGLIHLALQQGLDAVEHLAANLTPGSRDALDVAIIGAGPAGLAAALSCKARGLRYAAFDQEDLGGSVNQYPRQKLVMTQPVQLPLIGRMHFSTVTKEELLRYWRNVVRRTNLEIRAPVRVLDVQRQPGGGFQIETNTGPVQAQRVVLAIGRRGTPRKLGVPGEESTKVSYRLLEPQQYRDARVLVVGGGNSAAEAAIALIEAGARVTLSYRGGEFYRVAPSTRKRLEVLARSRLKQDLQSHLVRIESARVLLRSQAGERWIPNDQVFVFAGGELPSDFLQRLGLEIVTYTGQPHRRPLATPAWRVPRIESPSLASTETPA